LLRRLREAMAVRESAQARLDKVVVLIASNMVAEVCSLYLQRRDGSLELFATEGLNPEAVHNTHLKSGEGLVGLIAAQAEPMQFPDAQHHPAFSYRPETGEEVYQSFVGVPSCVAVTPSASSRYRTAPSGNTATRRSRRCKPRPWCSPR
jgi:phosphotransferase system enzyme I (PtsP)